MELEHIAFFVLLAVIIVVVWALVRNGVLLANLVPYPLAQELIKSAIQTGLTAAMEQANKTPTPLDNDLITAIAKEVAKIIGQEIALPPSNTAVTATVITAADDTADAHG